MKETRPGQPGQQTREPEKSPEHANKKPKEKREEQGTIQESLDRWLRELSGEQSKKPETTVQEEKTVHKRHSMSGTVETSQKRPVPRRIQPFSREAMDREPSQSPEKAPQRDFNQQVEHLRSTKRHVLTNEQESSLVLDDFEFDIKRAVIDQIIMGKPKAYED